MRKIFVVMLMIWGAMFTSCSDNVDRVYEDMTTPWEISMSVTKAEAGKVSFNLFRGSYLGALVDEINWGDGKTEKPGSMSVYSHEFEAGTYTIVAKGRGPVLLWIAEKDLTSLDLSKCTLLTELQCSAGKFTSLDLNDCQELTAVVCKAALTSLSVDACKNLTSLDCSKNQLTELPKLPSSVTSIVCSNNKLVSLDLSSYDNLASITCANNQLTGLKISPNVTSLDCSGNKLTSLDLSANESLTSLTCSKNELISLKVCTSNKVLACLTSISCGTNQLAELDLSNCRALVTVSFENNQMDKDAVDAVYTRLYKTTNSKATVTVYGNKSVGTPSIAIEKGWTVVSEKK
ncbi:leucine-rich repeat domain-containing protein [Butyricimonas synergistica]|uniref:leucine-rich repeat domain-containing protein n=1 Tax=Butyricimonas synergistica TaxID=544644 RepID=UPI0012DCA871|nr:hypothetical protein [Butyricimonas synergistica]